jgi:outer membrane protein OmpA-like peptidoglycan-associated protein
MSDEQALRKTGETAEAEPHESVPAGSASRSNLPPAVALAFVIIALLGVLIVMVLKSSNFLKSTSTADLSTLQAEANALRSEYNNQRIAMGLRPIEGTSEPIEEIASRMKKDADSLVALAGSYQKMLGEKDHELTARNAEILRSEKLRAALTADNTRLQTDMQRALVGASDMDLLRRDLLDVKAQRDALSTELKEVREKMRTMSAGVSAEDYADLQRRFDETLRAKEFFEARVRDLEGDLNKARLFARSENELVPAAVELFRSLRKLQGKTDSEISSAYSALGVSLGANVVQTLGFATGSSVLTAADDAAIRSLVDGIPDGDLLLAVGYASETGNVDANQTLSSDRATAAAQLITNIKRPGQLTQAVYLGQTSRFSSRIPERNQIVELWHIRKK